MSDDYLYALELAIDLPFSSRQEESFIRGARAAVHGLAAEVRRLQKENQELRAKVREEVRS